MEEGWEKERENEIGQGAQQRDVGSPGWWQPGWIGVAQRLGGRVAGMPSLPLESPDLQPGGDAHGSCGFWLRELRVEVQESSRWADA